MPSVRGEESPKDKAIVGVPQPSLTPVVVNFLDLEREEKLLPPQPVVPHVHIHPPYHPKQGTLRNFTLEKPADSPIFKTPSFQVPSPQPILNFQALVDNGLVIPPDTHGAVGPNHVMTVHNSQVRIQNRTGGILNTVSLDFFWMSRVSGIVSGVFDPKILYDPYNNRWIFVAIADAEQNSSSVLIAASQTSDPTGNWNVMRVPLTGSDVGSVWIDYPSLGFNKNWVAVHVNIFDMNGIFYQGYLYLFDKSKLYSGSSQNPTLIKNLDFTLCPAQTYDNSLSTLYLVESISLTNSQIKIYQVTGSIGSESIQLVSTVTTPTWNDCSNCSDLAPQLGTSNKISANDDRMQAVVYRNGSIWCTHTVFYPSDIPTRSSIQWLQISSTGTLQVGGSGLLQRGVIDDPTGVNYFSFPSIAVNKLNEVLIGYSRFSALQYASANYSFRESTDPPNTMRGDTVLKVGEAIYYKIYTGSINRWGDYSNTVVDPSDDTTMWTIQEYAASPSNTWATWWGEIPSQGITIVSGDGNNGNTGNTTTTNHTNGKVLRDTVEVRVGDQGFLNPSKSQSAALLYTPSTSGSIEMKIYSLDGKLVWSATKQTIANVQDEIDWNGTKSSGEQVETGIYFLSVNGAGLKKTKKIAVVR